MNCQTADVHRTKVSQDGVRPMETGDQRWSTSSSNVQRPDFDDVGDGS
jgi:hypothetical protein